ncbi:cupin domain-containing protein [Agromyces endophyticus]|uniref:cupin domain-containing protein n=1 Tax=Agromyces sp. H17E-10 TaxID=2932244 RepID=UPI001FD0B4B1|nr:cupin domain-containing protein [Agromyces sp. H17E-10]UOQ89149.1 cupin domain-containing protein [Agromyces sp. H17E-10]
MTGFVATRFEHSAIDWPDDVAIAADRVLKGTPTASTFVIEDASTHQLGLWRVTPGEFVTDHAGYLEYIHVLSGTGRLIDEGGVALDLGPGVTVLMQPGWRGRWVVHETITKAYTVINS